MDDANVPAGKTVEITILAEVKKEGTEFKVNDLTIKTIKTQSNPDKPNAEYEPVDINDFINSFNPTEAKGEKGGASELHRGALEFYMAEPKTTYKKSSNKRQNKTQNRKANRRFKSRKNRV